MASKKTLELSCLFEQGNGSHAHLKCIGVIGDDDLLVHFTAAQDAIAMEGFTRGMSDVNQLGFTKDRPTSGAGWNFAFRADAFPDFWSEEFGPSFSTAGNGCMPSGMVIFRSGGVECVHWDDFHQVIFWGPEVSSTILAFNVVEMSEDEADDWCQGGPSRQDDNGLPRLRWVSKSTEGQIVFDGSLEEAIDWADGQIPKPSASAVGSNTRRLRPSQ